MRDETGKHKCQMDEEIVFKINTASALKKIFTWHQGHWSPSLGLFEKAVESAPGAAIHTRKSSSHTTRAEYTM